MHDIKFIRDNPKIFNKKMNKRNVDISSENILKIDKLSFPNVFKKTDTKELSLFPISNEPEATISGF